MSDKVYGIGGSHVNMQEFLARPIVNLLLNMSGGLLPEHLTEAEVNLLKDKFGEEWFEELGYSEPEYKRPECDRNSVR